MPKFYNYFSEKKRERKYNQEAETLKTYFKSKNAPIHQMDVNDPVRRAHLMAKEIIGRRSKK